MKIDFYFDFLSPYSYLAYRIAREHFPLSAINPIPVSLPHIIAKSGNIPPANLEARARYLKKDLERSAAFYGLPSGFKVPERFPFDTRAELYKLIELIGDENVSKEEIDEFIMKTWQRIFHPNTNNYETITIDPDVIVDAKKILMKNTDEALKFGVYGVPFWRVTNTATGEIETFFGSDRFHHMASFLGIDPSQFYRYNRSKL